MKFVAISDFFESLPRPTPKLLERSHHFYCRGLGLVAVVVSKGKCKLLARLIPGSTAYLRNQSSFQHGSGGCCGIELLSALAVFCNCFLISCLFDTGIATGTSVVTSHWLSQLLQGSRRSEKTKQLRIWLVPLERRQQVLQSFGAVVLRLHREIEPTGFRGGGCGYEASPQAPKAVSCWWPRVQPFI